MSKANSFVKNAKGTLDLTSNFTKVRQRYVDIISRCFKQHAGEQIETPVFELSDLFSSTITRHSAASSSSSSHSPTHSSYLYRVKDQGGELLALRPDLRVPFARYLTMNKTRQMRAFQNGHVFQLHSPVMTQHHQQQNQNQQEQKEWRNQFVCDFNIAGDFSAQLVDAQILRVCYDVISLVLQTEYDATRSSSNNRNANNLSDVTAQFDFVIRIGHVDIESAHCTTSSPFSTSSSYSCANAAELRDLFDRLVLEKRIKVRPPPPPPNSAKSAKKAVPSAAAESATRESASPAEVAAVQEHLVRVWEMAVALGVPADRLEFVPGLPPPSAYFTGLVFACHLKRLFDDKDNGWCGGDDGQSQSGGGGVPPAVIVGGRYDDLTPRIDPHGKFRIPICGLTVLADLLVQQTVPPCDAPTHFEAELANGWEENGGENADEKEQLDTKQQQQEDEMANKKRGGGGAIKCAKGTADHHPAQMRVRQRLFDTIHATFRENHSAELDTPIIELKSVLTGKYGEDSKLIYDLERVDGEDLALRYDLTVPLARFLSQRPQLERFSRYQIGTVYRRDQPAMNRGRFREFYQCDFDLAGSDGDDVMRSDAECVQLIRDTLANLRIGRFLVHVNNRKLLDGLFECVGVPEPLFRPICSAVDKLDKMSWEEVRAEMTNEKGLDERVADAIGRYVTLPPCALGGALLEQFAADPLLANSSTLAEGLSELRTLFGKLAQRFPGSTEIMFNPALARGLDYYTGTIFEAVLEPPSDASSLNVGTVCGGGRYDNLVAKFDSSGKRSAPLPCIGFSFGVERLVAVLEHQHLQQQKQHKKAPHKGSMTSPPSSPTPASPTSLASPITPLVNDYSSQVLVASAQKDLSMERLKLLRLLLDAELRAIHLLKDNPKPLDQFEYCEKNAVPFCVIFGQSELDRDVVKIRSTRKESSDGTVAAAGGAGEKADEEEVPRSRLVERLRERLVAAQ